MLMMVDLKMQILKVIQETRLPKTKTCTAMMTFLTAQRALTLTQSQTERCLLDRVYR
ncbi:hypothetical protein DPMN_090404 [Dreissena polymorpha]|uniref:Uncharacterized protein n=1 Tax=Dreissena polymorpha TaxID=45954 RepID=A0A9D4KYJ7_DREPO|nr:hypothetical protein DPMN_090404 [Dreissena polymorpha]